MAEEELSMEERIKWLRERGIQITIPGEKTSEVEDGPSYDFTVVKIPHDSRLPYQEIILTGFEGKVGDQGLQLLKPFFRGNEKMSDLDQDLLSKNLSELGSDLKVSSKTINEQISEGAVEAFPLSHPSEENQFTRVSYYVDEVSRLKNLPPNQRGVKFADLCGYENVPLFGDIYVGRYAGIAFTFSTLFVSPHHKFSQGWCHC